ncbi:PepSY domain-containing protein [Aliikangiella sp. IMCC44653]
MKKYIRFCLTIWIALLSVTHVSAGPLVNSNNDQPCKIKSSKQVIATAEKRTGGKVVSIKLRKDTKQPVYRVRVLVDGKRVKNLTIEACR